MIFVLSLSGGGRFESLGRAGESSDAITRSMEATCPLIRLVRWMTARCASSRSWERMCSDRDRFISSRSAC